MAHDHSFPAPAKIVFSKGDKISLNGTDLRWLRDIEPCHVQVDVFTHETMSYSHGEVLRMMANDEMVVAHAFYEAPS
ncbi:hypothetical protein [Rhizobium leguminosarum]|uniref:hypothetical protein n=1 Tax=Rhizobium leguminosarum TaxID=384 RepID=UPI00103171F5|nr:hypothetical protein [Rhizobium leguminosarum]TAV81558.1 hypothetical protein ELI22_33940 [Rhizobium leguminosarum]TAV94164.1 hypothetical protein ELI21_10335 [Rhizobium leguminosarum]TAW35239.1 hypothetical protein ELI23_10375 [Rhizobium leguminosarum]